MTDVPAGSRECHLCGVVFRGNDDVVEAGSRFVHLACAESVFGAPSQWEHGDVKAWSEWARGVGWGSSAS